MIRVLRKVVKTIACECKNRGSYFAFLMLFVHFLGVVRSGFYRLLYLKNLKASLFFMQANSTIDIFDRKSIVILGKFVFIRKNTSIRVDLGGTLNVGDKVFINDNCTINCANRITIGENTKIAPNVCINDHDHNYKNPEGKHLIVGEVHIGKHVWIGANAVILKDTFIGDHAVIAAGSVVKGIVEAHTLFMNKRENKHVSFASSGDLVAVGKGS